MARLGSEQLISALAPRVSDWLRERERERERKRERKRERERESQHATAVLSKNVIAVR
jgi:hypothetical protein